MDFIAIDVEIANSNYASICQIGIASFKDGKLVDEWISLINPEDKFEPRNIKKHGIKADDVKCAHSSTTGALDEEALFYLRSRGLDIQSSEALMIRGFALEQLELIKNKKIFDYLMKLFQSWLKS